MDRNSPLNTRSPALERKISNPQPAREEMSRARRVALVEETIIQKKGKMGFKSGTVISKNRPTPLAPCVLMQHFWNQIRSRSSIQGYGDRPVKNKRRGGKFHAQKSSLIMRYIPGDRALMRVLFDCSRRMAGAGSRVFHSLVPPRGGSRLFDLAPVEGGGPHSGRSIFRRGAVRRQTTVARLSPVLSPSGPPHPPMSFSLSS